MWLPSPATGTVAGLTVFCQPPPSSFTRLPSGAGYFGTGLGLYIVRRLMELAHGRVSAHSDGVGQGASVHLTWPAAPAGALPAAVAGEEMRP